MTDRAELDRWMAAVADGERAAVAPLFGALWPPLVRYAARLVGDALAEDCAQDALVRLFAQAPRYDRERSALAWALALVTWECRTARKRRARRGETALDHAARASSIEDGAATAELRDLVRAALAEVALLDARDRDVILASITDDAELRRAIAPATFRKRLERALARLRTSWRSRHGTL